MALPSFLQRKDPKPAPAPASDPLGDDNGPVQAARTRARRRLIGAVVLLAIGVVVFPMLFETQPRPLPSDIPIELPRRDGPPARTAALPRNAPAVTVLPPVSEPASPAAAPAAAPVPAEAAAPAPAVHEPPPAARVDSAKSEPTRSEPPKSEPTKVEAARTEVPKAADARPAPAPAADARKGEADRARALLEGRSVAAASSVTAAASEPRNGRFVVQVGAYSDAATLREVRAKVEKLGLKTYVQSVETEAGKRTRVRVGPFTTRQEADSASGKLKGAGLPGNVLTL